MGLRMFVEPEVAERAIKVDRTAPARSAIRRQRTVRYSPNTRGHQQAPPPSIPRRRASSNLRTRQLALADRERLLEEIRRRDPNADRPFAESIRSEISDLRVALNRQQRVSERHQLARQRREQASEAADVLRAEASQRSRQTSGRAHLRDALSYEHPSQRLRIIRDSTVPDAPEVRPALPESNVEYEHLPILRQSNDGTLASPDQAIGLSYTPEVISGQLTQAAQLGNATLTPGFAPAHQQNLEGEVIGSPARLETSTPFGYQLPSFRELRDAAGRGENTGSGALSMEINDSRDQSTGRTRRGNRNWRDVEAEILFVGRRRGLHGSGAENDDDVAALPPLRRMSRRNEDENSPAGSSAAQRNNVDGLGDRQRSFSPDDNDWNTMLSTIPPDHRLPSASSSFASATASASSLSSNSASSYGTLVTAPSTSADVEACPADLSVSDSDSPDEDDEETESQPQGSASTELLVAQSEHHLNRIESLSRRLMDQRSRDGQISRQRRMEQREEELVVLEQNLERLERQIEEERSAAGSWGPWEIVRAGRERL